MSSFVRLMTAAALVAGTLFAASTAEAGLFGRRAAEEQLPAGPMPAPLPASMAYAVPGDCCTPVCPTPCIKYRNAIFDCKLRCCDPCAPPIKAVLNVKNPCTCCPVDVPVCLPSCCCGAPTIECRKALLGASIVSYSWCCGVTVNVRFDRCGDVLVTYRGT